MIITSYDFYDINNSTKNHYFTDGFTSLDLTIFASVFGRICSSLLSKNRVLYVNLRKFAPGNAGISRPPGVWISEKMSVFSIECTSGYVVSICWKVIVEKVFWNINSQKRTRLIYNKFSYWRRVSKWPV